MIRTKLILICCTMAIVFALVLARIHPFGDAGLYSAPRAEKSPIENFSAPPEVRGILVNKCADCHSMSVNPPVYGRFAPVSWLLERDINLGRQAMNLDSWDQYSTDHQQALAAKIVQETKSHDMPLLQYRMIHWNARVTDAEVLTLARWARAQTGSSDQADLPVIEADPFRGKMLFEKRCAGCHELTQNHEGPRLAGVFGRASGSVGDYAYSAALKKANIVWDDTTLDKWLADSDALVTGNNMDFPTPRAAERQDIIAFLKQNSGR